MQVAGADALGLTIHLISRLHVFVCFSFKEKRVSFHFAAIHLFATIITTDTALLLKQSHQITRKKCTRSTDHDVHDTFRCMFLSRLSKTS